MNLDLMSVLVPTLKLGINDAVLLAEGDYRNTTCLGLLVIKKFVLSMIICTFASSVPTKPLNDAQMRGAFLYIYVLLSKYANGKITALRETLHDRG